MDDFGPLKRLSEWNQLENWLLEQDADTQKKLLELLEADSETDISCYPRQIQRAFRVVARHLKRSGVTLQAEPLRNEVAVVPFNEHLEDDSHGASTFVFPSDRLPPELGVLLKATTREEVRKFMGRLAPVLLSSKNMRSSFVALLYLTGADLITLIGAKSNSIKDIAAALNIRKQTLHKMVKRVARHVGIDYLAANTKHRKQKGRNVTS